MTYFCQFFLAFWLFDMPEPPLLVLIAVIAGGMISLFSRYGGIITIIASLFFAATFTTGQLFQFSIASPSTTASLACRPTAQVYQVDEPIISHIVGFWVALAGGILTVVLGVSWRLPQGFRLRQSMAHGDAKEPLGGGHPVGDCTSP
jgi:hypothetical protein